MMAIGLDRWRSQVQGYESQSDDAISEGRTERGHARAADRVI
jgi:hypothetical protein